MSQSSTSLEKVRARIGGLLLLERALYTYLAALEQAQQADLAQIPPDLRARLDARAAAIADMQRMLSRKEGADPE